MNPQLHPWLSTADALKAARDATNFAHRHLGLTRYDDELFSEALVVLTACALPPLQRERVRCAQCGAGLENVRAGAKFCSRSCKEAHKQRRNRAGIADNPPLPASPSAYIGSMWSWPEDQRAAYAVREVGLQLCNYFRTDAGPAPIPIGDWWDEAVSIAVEEPDIPDLPCIGIVDVLRRGYPYITAEARHNPFDALDFLTDDGVTFTPPRARQGFSDLYGGMAVEIPTAVETNRRKH